MSELLTLTRPQGANRALVDGSVSPAGYTWRFADQPVLVAGFRAMVRGLEYDVAEMAVTTYLTAREHGVRFTALPVFLVRAFHHSATQVLRDGRIRTATDLTGGRVGVNRGYTVTTGVWGRAALAEAGLDLASVTWVRSGDEHVASYAAPPNVVPAGAPLEELLLAGELDAVVGADLQHPDIVPLLPEDAGWRSFQERGLFPVNHLVVVRDELLEHDPGVAAAVFEAFVEAKHRYVDALRAGEVTTEQDRLLLRVMEETGRDPLPYGLDANRDVLAELIGHARAQGILTRGVVPEDVVLDLTE